MAFDVQIDHSAGVAVFALSGRLTIGEASDKLHRMVEERLAAGDSDILLDMSRVTYVDSCGLGAIVTCLSCARNRGGFLRLANVPSRIQDLLAVSSLSAVLPIVETESKADSGR